MESRFGTLTYGRRPEGYDAWVFRETSGGGAVTLPYAVTPEGEILVGLLPEKRPNMGSMPVLCVVGGFVEPGETHEKAQAREAEQEAGINTVKAKKLGGVGINPNRAFFVADPGAGEGVQAFGLQLPFNMLEADDDLCWKLKSANELASVKKASDLRFFRWRHAAHLSPDGLALAAIAKLIAEVLPR